MHPADFVDSLTSPRMPSFTSTRLVENRRAQNFKEFIEFQKRLTTFPHLKPSKHALNLSAHLGQRAKFILLTKCLIPEL